MLQLLNHVLSEDLAATSDPTDVLAGVGPATKLLSAYTRRGTNPNPNPHPNPNPNPRPSPYPSPTPPYPSPSP